MHKIISKMLNQTWFLKPVRLTKKSDFSKKRIYEQLYHKFSFSFSFLKGHRKK